MNRRAKMQLWTATGLLLVAGIFFYNSWMEGRGGAKAFFYDLSKAQLFVADASMIPPIRGIDGAEEDGVKAVVIEDKPGDKNGRRIAYLERYSPELKQDMEMARANNTAPLIGRGGAQALRFVRREQEKEWFPMISSEGQKIVSEWTTPGPDGLSPVVCTP